VRPGDDAGLALFCKQMRPLLCPSCGKQLHDCECEWPLMPSTVIAILVLMSALLIIGAEAPR
jgi:hypothetical protein